MFILLEAFAFITLAAFLSGQAIYWLWWFIGSPVIIDNNCEIQEGRIFSFWGRFIAKQYDIVETQKHLDFLAQFPNGEPTKPYMPTHLNFWKIAGCCIYCMAVWAAAALAVFWDYLAVQNLNYNGGFFITAFAWFFYTFLTLFFVKKEFEQ